MNILLIDNFDSFTHNVADQLRRLGAEVTIFRNDAPLELVHSLAFEGVVVSPGPGNPSTIRDFGISKKFIVNANVPTLGICLGMQGMAAHLGGTVIRAPQLVHGEATPVVGIRGILLEGVAEGSLVARYHSLCVGLVPEGFDVTAKATDGTIMAMESPSRHLYGIQFHPESYLTPNGDKIIQNFLEIVRKNAE